MNQDIQKAQDLLNAALAQRNDALNALVQANAELSALRREIQRLTEVTSDSE